LYADRDLYRRSSALLRLIERRILRSGRATGSFSSEALLNELGRKERPKWARTVGDLEGPLALLRRCGVVESASPPMPEVGVMATQHSVIVDRTGRALHAEVLAMEEAALERRIKALEALIEARDPLAPVYETTLVPPELSSDVRQVKREGQAERRVRALHEQYGPMAFGPLKGPIECEVAAAEETLRQSRRYRTFAKPVALFLRRLYQRRPELRVGTYKHHSWGEFSVDAWLQVKRQRYEWDRQLQLPRLTFGLPRRSLGEGLSLRGPTSRRHDYSGVYFNREAVTQFFTELDAIAREGVEPYGRLAWRAIYNDMPLASELNKRFGKGHVIHAENHGPAPDHKLHIHLDFSPLTLPQGELTGVVSAAPVPVDREGQSALDEPTVRIQRDSEPEYRGLSPELVSESTRYLEPSVAVFVWLQGHLDEIVGAEQRYRVDRRAIAGAIAWEALMNPPAGLRKYLTGFGRAPMVPAKPHVREKLLSPFEGRPVVKQVEEAGYLPRRSRVARKRFLETGGAITTVAAIMAAFADATGGTAYYRNAGAYGRDLADPRCDPVLLTHLYNGVREGEGRELATWRAYLDKKSPDTPLRLENPMARWVYANMQYIEAAVGAPQLAESCRSRKGH
jgi:hypothetical protein